MSIESTLPKPKEGPPLEVGQVRVVMKGVNCYYGIVRGLIKSGPFTGGATIDLEDRWSAPSERGFEGGRRAPSESERGLVFGPWDILDVHHSQSEEAGDGQ